MNDVTHPELGTFANDERFHRDMAQVHLLMDFISGNPEKSLDALKDVELVDTEGKKIEVHSAQQVVEQICMISYPPTGGSIAANARQAALLLVVKDRLNRIASPARDLTIAFTGMFVAASVNYATRWEIFSRPLASGKRWKGASPNPQQFSPRDAYPEFEKQARDFWGTFMRLPVYALAAIIFIIWVNWDIQVASPGLQQLVKAHTEYADLMSDKNFVPDTDACKHPPQGREAMCSRARAAERRLLASRQGLLEVINQPWWLVPLHPVAFGVRLFAPDLNKPPIGDASVYVPFIGLTFGVIGALNSVVIPMAFGFLGTVAALLRAIGAKVRDRVLSPRDYGSSRSAVFVGMVAGLAVGLFVNAGNTSMEIGSGKGGTISISTAGLAFLSGFGATHFFKFLEYLLTRVFPDSVPSSDGAVRK